MHSSLYHMYPTWIQNTLQNNFAILNKIQCLAVVPLYCFMNEYGKLPYHPIETEFLICRNFLQVWKRKLRTMTHPLRVVHRRKEKYLLIQIRHLARMGSGMPRAPVRRRNQSQLRELVNAPWQGHHHLPLQIQRVRMKGLLPKAKLQSQKKVISLLYSISCFYQLFSSSVFPSLYNGLDVLLMWLHVLSNTNIVLITYRWSLR